MSQPAAPKKQTPREAAHKKAVGVIRELAEEGRSMILVTHEIRFARDVADRVIFMDGGHIVEVLRKKFSKHSAAGKPKKTKKKEEVSS